MTGRMRLQRHAAAGLGATKHRDTLTARLPCQSTRGRAALQVACVATPHSADSQKGAPKATATPSGQYVSSPYGAGRVLTPSPPGSIDDDGACRVSILVADLRT